MYKVVDFNECTGGSVEIVWLRRFLFGRFHVSMSLPKEGFHRQSFSKF